LSVEKSVTLSDDEYRDAATVAKYQHRTFSAFARHCINLETSRRIKDAARSNGGKAGKPPES
jgi:hypothetical protein